MKALLAMLAVALVVAVPAGATDSPPTNGSDPSVRIDPDGSLVSFDLDAPQVSVSGGGCGYVTYQGTVKKTNPYGVVLWTWRAFIKVGYCNYKVITVPYWYSQPIDSCCSWDYKAQVGRKITGLGTAYIDVYIKGQFQACVGVVISVCDTDYPWFTARINGNGVLTTYAWGY